MPASLTPSNKQRRFAPLTVALVVVAVALATMPLVFSWADRGAVALFAGLIGITAATNHVADRVQMYGREASESYLTGYDLGLRDGARTVAPLRLVRAGRCAHCGHDVTERKAG